MMYFGDEPGWSMRGYCGTLAFTLDLEKESCPVINLGPVRTSTIDGIGTGEGATTAKERDDYIYVGTFFLTGMCLLHGRIISK